MRIVKIIKTFGDYIYDCDGSVEDVKTIINASTDWLTITDEEYLNFKELFKHYNAYNNDYKYSIIEEVTIEETKLDLLPLVESIRKQMESRKRKEELAAKKEAEKAQKLEASALERKRKRLAKLQAELDAAKDTSPFTPFSS